MTLRVDQKSLGKKQLQTSTAKIKMEHTKINTNCGGFSSAVS